MEEIIIDGINVWSCKHYDLENNYCDQSYLGGGGLLKNTKNPKRCECSPNCYYKQLKRLEQENAELKTVHKQLKQMIKSKESLLEKAIQENAELKERLKILDEEEVVYEVTETEHNNFKKYKQALEEIRGICSNTCEKNKDCIHSCYECKSIDEPLAINRIKDKINEVIGD